MGKKLPIISTLILLISTAPAPGVLASGGEYWTYDEMSALSREFAAEMEFACAGKDPWCKEMYLHRLFEMDEKHQALMNYEAVPMVITSVNPSKNTISVIYRDDFLQDIIHGMTNEAYVKDLFIVRYDKNQNSIAYEIEIKNGTIGDKIHQEVIEFESNNGEKWLPTNKEVTFSMMDGSFDDNMINKFWYYFSTTRGNWGHMMNPSECLSQIVGITNMECRLVYRANNVDYIPEYVPDEVTPKDPDNMKRIDDEIMENILNDLSDGESEPEPEPEIDPEPESEPSKPESDSEPESSKTTESNTESEPKVESGHMISAPDTGALTKEDELMTESAWWGSALLISGLSLLAWWFLPTKYAKYVKKLKKSKKGVDFPLGRNNPLFKMMKLLKMRKKSKKGVDIINPI